MSRALAIALLASACTRTVQTSVARDEQTTVATVAVATASVTAERHTVIERAPTHVEEVEAWDEEVPAAVPSAPPRKVHHPAVKRIDYGAVKVDTERHATRAAATQTTTTAATTEHQVVTTKSVTRPALGFQLWLVLIPAALVALALVAWKLRRLIPWIP